MQSYSTLALACRKTHWPRNLRQTWKMFWVKNSKPPKLCWIYWWSYNCFRRLFRSNLFVASTQYYNLFFVTFPVYQQFLSVCKRLFSFCLNTHSSPLRIALLLNWQSIASGTSSCIFMYNWCKSSGHSSNSSWFSADQIG